MQLPSVTSTIKVIQGSGSTSVKLRNVLFLQTNVIFSQFYCTNDSLKLPATTSHIGHFIPRDYGQEPVKKKSSKKEKTKENLEMSANIAI